MYQKTINIHESISDTAAQHTEMLLSHSLKIIAVYVYWNTHEARNSGDFLKKYLVLEQKKIEIQ